MGLNLYSIDRLKRGHEMLNKFKGLKLKWYHFVVFWIPGGMFWLSCLLAYQYRNSKLFID